MAGRNVCLNHAGDPELAERLAESRRKGGKARAASLDNRPPPVPAAERPEWAALATSGDVAEALAHAARALLFEGADPRRMNALAVVLRELGELRRAQPAGAMESPWEKLTPEQLDYIVQHEGQLPEGVTTSMLLGRAAGS